MNDRFRQRNEHSNVCSLARLRIAWRKNLESLGNEASKLAAQSEVLVVRGNANLRNVLAGRQAFDAKFAIGVNGNIVAAKELSMRGI